MSRTIIKMTAYNNEGRVVRMMGEMPVSIAGLNVDIDEEVHNALADQRVVSIKLEKDVRDG